MADVSFDVHLVFGELNADLFPLGRIIVNSRRLTREEFLSHPLLLKARQNGCLYSDTPNVAEVFGFEDVHDMEKPAFNVGDVVILWAWGDGVGTENPASFKEYTFEEVN